MKKNVKKIVTIVLAFCIMVSAMSLSVFAAEARVRYIIFRYAVKLHMQLTTATIAITAVQYIYQTLTQSVSTMLIIDFLRSFVVFAESLPFSFIYNYSELEMQN